MSGAVWGASDARRRGAAAPSALRDVGAESSISLAITVGASAFGHPKMVAFPHHHFLIGGRRARRADSPPFTHTGRETSGYMSIIDAADAKKQNRFRVPPALDKLPRQLVATTRGSRARHKYHAEAVRRGGLPLRARSTSSTGILST